MAIDLVLDHLWQSTVFAAGAGLLALTLRRNRAEVRYWLWLAASMKFLVPFAVLTSFVNRVAPRPPAPAALTMVLSVAAQPFSTSELQIATPSVAPAVWQMSAWLPFLLVGLWCLGCAVLLLTWARRWQHVALVVRTAPRLEQGREVEILRRLERQAGRTRRLTIVSSDAPFEPGVFGVRSPVLLWPRHIAGRLDDEQVETVLIHELAHVRRGDNLAAALHMFVQAVFWFHPVVWWLGARLVHERELACDDEVILSGHNPRVYAESILKMCQLCLESPLLCVAGVTGADLKRRIETIMRNRAGEGLGGWQKLLLGGAAALVAAGPMVVANVHSPALLAQSLAAAESSPAFEVASVRPNKSGDGNSRVGIEPGGRFIATNVTLRMLIRSAYQLQEFQLVGGPSWIDTERFDITAKAEGNLAPPVPGGPPATIQLMLRGLLADRFKLAMRDDTRQLPIYALVAERNDGTLGPQLRRSRFDCVALAAAVAAGGAPPAPTPDGRQPCHMRSGPGRLSGDGFPLSQLATTLSQLLQRTVIDRSGLSGTFDIDLSFTPDQMPPELASAGAPPIDPNGPSLFAAVQEQLGLKLKAQKGPVAVMVVDRVDRPTPE